jgi:hypothetical protein
MPELTQQLSQTFLWLIGLVVVAPLVATIADITHRHGPISGCALWTGYICYGFRVLFLLVVQFGSILVIFFLGPVWIFMLFLTVADLLVAHWMPNSPTVGAPILCRWFHVALPYCIYLLIAYHLISAVLAYLIFQYGYRFFDAARSWYEGASQRLAERLND